MTDTSLQAAADAVIRRARLQGSVAARDIRAETKLAGLPDARWHDVVELVKSALKLQRGRYVPIESAGSSRASADQTREQIAQALRSLLRQHRAAVRKRERRGEERVEFLQPVKVTSPQGKVFQLLCRDLSTTGLRLLGTSRLLGQKVTVEIPNSQAKHPLVLRVRILWTCAVGDDLFENGGTFLELLDAEPSRAEVS